ncbi:glutathione S-transferase family protein [Bradyrhizobium cajani]|uniref:Glutathione S-transferase family protein n=1 Tax=Bradyrhizobium cajani TaxID=1928661 RepID=A0A844TF11_9BRAD|nr:glutathione S-transferase family protein [Bradyrhizobium cajani]MCP3370169.1 glutathione S-transferase family protein [Bradyrhizobium cajani]MVT77618.1 glutathione S-transferase family protein [Bradyrhizobium cajani]
MDPILIYGFPMGSSMGLVAALEWLGKPYRLCRVDMLGEMRSPSYARINPRHETPAFITGQGEVLTETMAIVAWLEARDAERRISFDPLSRQADRMHQLMAFVNTGFTAAFAPLWAAMEGEAMEPAIKSALRAFGARKVIERHDKLEQMIGSREFLLGDRPTLADALLAGVARWLDVHAVAESSRWPKLAAVRIRLEADPAVLYAMALENGDSDPGTGLCAGHIALADVIARFGK